MLTEKIFNTRKIYSGGLEMELETEDLCANCCRKNCPMKGEFTKKQGCIFNLIIFENENKVLFYNIPEKSIYLIERNKGIREITFKEAIREIDIIPTKKPDWKRFQILSLARDLGFFGIKA